MTRIKQDRSRKGGHKHSLNIQDYPSILPDGYYQATIEQRIAWTKSRKYFNLAKLIGDGHPLAIEAARNLRIAAIELEELSKLK